VTKMRVGVRAHIAGDCARFGALSVACLIPLASPEPLRPAQSSAAAAQVDDNLARSRSHLSLQVHGEHPCLQHCLVQAIDFFNPTAGLLRRRRDHWDRGSSSPARAHSAKATDSLRHRPPALGMLAGHTLIGELSFPRARASSRRRIGRTSG